MRRSIFIAVLLAGLAASADTVVYRNERYGFSFTLPASWKGFTILADQWSAASTQVGQSAEEGPALTIRHPLWTEAKPRQDIPILVLTRAQWEKSEKEEILFGAAPIGPSELGRNREFVFALPARFNFAYPDGFEEVNEILARHPLRATK